MRKVCGMQITKMQKGILHLHVPVNHHAKRGLQMGVRWVIFIQANNPLESI